MKRTFLLTALLAATLVSARAQANPDQHGPVITPPGTANVTDATNAPDSGPVVTPSNQPAPPDAASSGGAPSLASPGPVVNAPAANGQADDIYDIRPPYFYIQSLAWLWLTLLALALIALVVGLIVRFKPLRALRARSAYEIALEKLEKARALLDEKNPEPYAVAVSETIRSYLAQRFHAPSTRQTTEEFLRQMVHDSHSPLTGHRDLLREFLEACDLVKFAHYQPGREELEQVQQRAVSFVTATRPVEPNGPAARPAPAPIAAANGSRP